MNLHLTFLQRGNLQDAINANVVNGTHFPEKEMVRLFKGTCEAIRAMHTFRASIGSKSSAPSQNGDSGRHSDDEERFPHPEDDHEDGFSYDGASVPLVTRHRVEEEGDVVFDGDQELQHENADNLHTEVVPYAHRDLKPGYVPTFSIPRFHTIQEHHAFR